MSQPNELHPEVVRVMEWLKTSEAVAYSRAKISRSSLPFSAESLRDEALSRIWVMFNRNPDRESLENVASYMKRVMRSICAGKKPREDVTPPKELEEMEVEVERTLRPKRDDDVLQLRTLVEIGTGRVDVKSAVLNVLTLTDPMIDQSDLPQPRQGSKPEQARWWPAAFLATRNFALFPQSGSSDAAQRKRLSLFMMGCEQVLDAAKFDFERKEQQDG